MRRTQIILKDDQHEALVKIARTEKQSVSEIIRQIVERELKRRQKEKMLRAADIMRDEYLTNTALTAFNVLDGDDFMGES